MIVGRQPLTARMDSTSDMKISFILSMRTAEGLNEEVAQKCLLLLDVSPK